MPRRPHRACYPPAVLALTGVAAGVCGCGGAFRTWNTAAELTAPIPASADDKQAAQFKAAVLYPARDLLTFDPLWRALFGTEAWNANSPGVADSCFYTSPTPDRLTPARVAAPATDDPPPQPPFTIRKRRRTHDRAPGFIGEDALGRTFMFKLDEPDYPELGTAATIITARCLAALGYNVPAEFLVRLEGTGDPLLDGRRASASLFVPGVRGSFSFDRFRHRRELRGLRLASAWLNDTDRVSSNTLACEVDGRAKMYLIDFEAALGSWQGRPKEPWRGWRPQWSLGAAFATVVTLGLWHAEPDRQQPIVSPAVGRFEAAHFDPRRWTTQVPNNAFEHMDDADARWMIEKLRLLDRPQIEAIVAAAAFSRPADARYVVETLLQRRARILALAPLEHSGP